MIPSIDEDITLDVIEEEIPSKDFAIDEDKLNGTIDQLEEIKQAIYIILNTERYEHEIYDWNYGFEVADLIGEDYVYVKPILEDRIREALLQDDRIIEVNNFIFERNRNSVTVTFDVATDFGILEEEEITVDV